MSMLILSILHQKNIFNSRKKVNHDWTSLDSAISIGHGWRFSPGSGTGLLGQMTAGHIHQLCMALRGIRRHRQDKDLHDCGCKSKCQWVKLGSQNIFSLIPWRFRKVRKVPSSWEERKTPGLWRQGPATQPNFAKQLNLSQHSRIWGFSQAELTQSTSWIWEDCW